MKSIKKLKHKLQKINKIESGINNYFDIDEVSIIQFLKLKYCIKQKKKITKELKLAERFAKGCKLLYEYDTRRWINDPRINCRKYCKLEAKAKYSRDLKLHKCGVLAQRPILPFFQKIINFIQNIEISNNVFFKRIKSIKSSPKELELNMDFENESIQNMDISSQISTNEIKAERFRKSLKYNPKRRNTVSKNAKIGSIRIGKTRAALDLGCK